MKGLTNLTVLGLILLALNIGIFYENHKYCRTKTSPNLSTLKKGISPEIAKEYIGENVFIVLSNFATPYAIYGVVMDVIKYEGECYIILKTHYNTPAEQFIKCKNIHYIRRRHKNE